MITIYITIFFFSSRRRHTRLVSDWSSDVCSSDLDLLSIQAAFNDVGVYGDLSGALHVAASMWQKQIGRASCGKSVDLGGRRIIKKKKKDKYKQVWMNRNK